MPRSCNVVKICSCFTKASIPEGSETPVRNVYGQGEDSVTGTKPGSVHLVSLLLLNRVRMLSSALLMLQALKQDPAFHRGCQGREPGEGQFGIIDYAPQQAERISGSGHSNKASSQQACQSPVLQAAARCRAVDNHEVDDWRTNQRISSPGNASGWNFSHMSRACLHTKEAKKSGRQ